MVPYNHIITPLQFLRLNSFLLKTVMFFFVNLANLSRSAHGNGPVHVGSLFSGIFPGEFSEYSIYPDIVHS